MEPQIHVVTLAVNDLERALVFYREGTMAEALPPRCRASARARP
jgi:catechol 2,3-dioxygenase-like lactoylglutathione lyase family enzyme